MDFDIDGIFPQLNRRALSERARVWAEDKRYGGHVVKITLHEYLTDKAPYQDTWFFYPIGKDESLPSFISTSSWQLYPRRTDRDELLNCLKKSAILEAERIYEAIKAARKTISPNHPDIDYKLFSAAKQEVANHKKEFKTIKEKHLCLPILFPLTMGQEKGRFIGKLVQIVLKDAGYGGLNYQKLSRTSNKQNHK
jgi:hypothetical protein